jgi:hypothetical protein
MFSIPGCGSRFGANDAGSWLPSKNRSSGTTGYAILPAEFVDASE